jgi:hypothetical protein
MTNKRLPRMVFKSFYLYLIGSIAALLIFIYELVKYYNELDVSEIILSAMPVIILAYLTFKVYHEQNDDELM